MDTITPAAEAFGKPGIPPRWTRSGKDAVGTAYAAASRVWYTLAQGALTELYHPTVDRPQVRDVQFLFTDGATFFHGERRDCDSHAELLSPSALGFRVVTEDRQGRYRCHKEILGDPHLSCLLIHTRLEVTPALAHALRLFVLCAPHLGGGGAHNCGEIIEVAGRTLLTAARENNFLAIGASRPFAFASAGFVGASDGWTDIAEHLAPTWSFRSATDGNIALTGEIPLDRHGRQPHTEFTLAIAFGDSQPAAVNALLQCLSQPYAETKARFLEQWARTEPHRLPLATHSQDGGELYRRSVSVLLAHEDKTYPGALIASLSIPWGEAKGDDDLGGYHLVWTRDLVHSASGLLASGEAATARRALVYLSAAQHDDGGFAQNFWINGSPYWQGIQLDEVAFPIILAWRLWRQKALGDFDPYAMVRRAAGYLMRHGPATQEERWEEAGGYSPSSLAAHIAGLVCAAEFARDRDDTALAQLALETADFLEAHLEPWTVTSQGALLPGVNRHYIRINPAPLAGHGGNEDPDSAVLRLANVPPGLPAEFPARDIVDGGFLELVRYGIRAPDDALIADSVRVVDAVLKAQTPFGPCWHRYNHDGYGQQANGGPYLGYGRGGVWPLLTGERGMYELAAGRDATAYLHALEQMANHLRMLPEQLWDLSDNPAQFLRFGRASGSAMPLMWAHAEYVTLLRSIADGHSFDLIPPVSERYAARSVRPHRLEIWKLHRQLPRLPPGATLRIQLTQAFFLHFSRDGWATVAEERSTPTACGFEYVDLTPRPGQTAPLQFTFRYAEDGHWQGQDFLVAINQGAVI